MYEILRKRFLAHPERHAGIAWEEAEARLNRHPEAAEVLRAMEETGGEPDVIGREAETGRLIFCDCSPESPKGRRSLCYDEEALQARRRNPPTGSAWGQAGEIGVRMLDETLYRRLQELGTFDTKTSSWIATPAGIREKGGALFCEQRYGTVFTFHNGADSYYSVRGWRGFICL